MIDRSHFFYDAWTLPFDVNCMENHCLSYFIHDQVIFFNALIALHETAYVKCHIIISGQHWRLQRGEEGHLLPLTPPKYFLVIIVQNSYILTWKKKKFWKKRISTWLKVTKLLFLSCPIATCIYFIIFYFFILYHYLHHFYYLWYFSQYFILEWC